MATWFVRFTLWLLFWFDVENEDAGLSFHFNLVSAASWMLMQRHRFVSYCFLRSVFPLCVIICLSLLHF
ncbi:hypothetical protein vseg_020007 [Gypsophila vaccaria]